jgi:hypothetical protein
VVVAVQLVALGWSLAAALVLPGLAMA